MPTNKLVTEISNKKKTARARLLESGSILFSKNGFSGCSIREICSHAETSSNMIHHYFGNKKGLYDEILSGFSQDVWTVPARVISKAPKNHDHLILLLEIFVEETLEALIAHRHLYELVVRELVVFDSFETYNALLVRFLEDAKAAGIVRETLDVNMLTGLILDRLGNQILFAPWIEKTHGYSVISDPEYKQRWLKANLDLMLNGILSGK